MRGYGWRGRAIRERFPSESGRSGYLATKDTKRTKNGEVGRVVGKSHTEAQRHRGTEKI